jgi:predicted MFS family arabinose efflux permease
MHPWRRQALIALTAFLTLVDLFAAQAILPSLARAYGVSPAAMGFAVNASTLGMSIAGLGIAFFGKNLDRRRGIVTSLALLSVPTLALAFAPDLTTFTLLRIAQGLCMSAAFTLMLSYLAEHCSMADTAGAFAAYVTGNVASNLIGRLVSATAADHLGLSGNFIAFAALNLAGAGFVWLTLARTPAIAGAALSHAPAPWTVWHTLWMQPALRAAFTIGFLILFVFIGTFTYVNFVLARAPFALAPMTLGLVYFVFAPAMLTTPLAGRFVARHGVRKTFLLGMGAALLGAPLLVAPGLPAVLTGLVLIGAGTFFAQATTTGFVGRAAGGDAASANGVYLASYFSGGLVGALVLGQIFDRLGWAACVAVLALALLAATALASQLRVPTEPS